MSSKNKMDTNLVNDPNATKEAYAGTKKTQNDKTKPRLSMSRHFLGKEVPHEFQIATTEEFVKRFHGTNAVSKILILSNGFGACKFIRSIRRWCKEMFLQDDIIQLYVMAIHDDLASKAEYIDLADYCASLPGGLESYSNVDLIKEVAIGFKIDAIWPGWDAPARSSKLAEMCSKNSITLIGPTLPTLSLATDTISMLIVAQTLSIPTVPWNGSSVRLGKIGLLGKKLKIPDEVYEMACITQVELGLAISKRIGFPVVLKPSQSSEKGIRVIESVSDFSTHFHLLYNEYQSPIVIMKHMHDARYVEIQILGDRDGNVVSVFTRDCTIQRHNTRIVEEAPAIFTMPKYFEEMERYAVEVAKAIKFQGAGSAFFIFHPTDSKSYFFDFCPHIQVEHACTEMLANVNLCACQVQLAMGVPLHRIKDIRLMVGYGPWESSAINFDILARSKTRSFGHVIAARLAAEDIQETLLPTSSGTVKDLAFRSSKDVWGYFAVSNYKHVSSTPFGHVFAWGENRNDARQNLVTALKELTTFEFPISSVSYLLLLLDTSEFVHNAFYSSHYSKIVADKTRIGGRPETLMAVMAACIHIADRQIAKVFREHQSMLEKGRIFGPEELVNHAEIELASESLKYKVVAVKSGENLYTLIMNDSYKEVVVHRLPDGGIFMTFDGTSHTTHLNDEGGRYYVTVGSKNCVFYRDTNPAILRSPAPGKLVSLLAKTGDELVKDQPYAEVEVMKSIMTLFCKENGVVRFSKFPGDILERDAVIGHLELDFATSLPEVETYTGTWTFREDSAQQDGHIRRLGKYKTMLSNCLAGYCFPDPYNEPHLRKTVRSFIGHLKSPKLPLEELNDALKKLATRIPSSVEQRLRGIMRTYEGNMDSVVTSFPTGKIAHIIDDYASSLARARDRDAFFITVQDILHLIQRYRNGIRSHMKSVVNVLLRQYFEVESHFQHSHYDRSVRQIRERYKEDMQTVMQLIFSHSKVGKKSLLVILLLDEMLTDSEGLTEDLSRTLNDLTTLECEEHSRVALKARKFLIAAHTPSYEIRRNQLESILLPAVDKNGANYNTEGVRHLIESQTAIFDVLHEFFYAQNLALCNIAMEIYIRRIYVPYELTSVQHCEHQLSHRRLAVPAVYFQFTHPDTHPELQDIQAGRGNPLRIGCITAMDGIEYFFELTDIILNHFESGNKRSTLADGIAANEPIYLLTVAIKNLGDISDDQMSHLLQQLCIQNRDDLLARRVRRITFMVLKDKCFPRLFTYRARDFYEEDRVGRHLEPSGFYQLEINRLSLYEIERLTTENSRMHLYIGLARLGDDRKLIDYRFFMRAVVRHSDLITREASFEYLVNEGERVFLEAIEELELAMNHPFAKRTEGNHVFLTFLPCVAMEPSAILDSMGQMVLSYASRLWKLRVLQVEMKFLIFAGVVKKSFRLFVSSELGYFMDVTMYEEVAEGAIVRFRSIAQDRPGPYDGLEITSPYKTRDYIQQKRFMAQSQDTTYCYNFPDMFRQMTERLWHEFITARLGEQILRPNQVLLECNELVMRGDQLAEVQRPPGENDIGLVAWRLRLATPEFRDGRELFLIANDITLSSGAIGIREAILFDKVSQLARHRGAPRLFISSTCGVRVGVADEVKALFRVAWRDPKRLDRGCKYLYLTSEDYANVANKNVIQTALIEENGETRYRITDVIGFREGLGIENLHFASMVESETIRAYDDVVTISMVTSQAAGIAAHIVRLGRRVVQIENAAVILTNYLSFNRTLDSDAYASNQQIGGCEIMAKCGIAHKIESDDLEGIYTMLQWLSYIPQKRNGDLPIVTPNDEIDRKIDFTITKSPFDPRIMLTGRFCRERWESGFFDRDSFTEILKDFAPSAIVGRARLGGIPVGVVAAEMRMIEFKVPADPGELNSHERITHYAGNILYADSAEKIANAIRDFNREELPLMIFANWHDISSGQSGMMNGVLKHTTAIVEALREYKQPVLVYLPPHAEMRNGTWNLFSTFVNPRCIEMYADRETKAGSYDPMGVCERKFRSKEVKKVIYRLDEEIINWREEMLSHHDDKSEEFVRLEEKIRERVSSLTPLYVSAAVAFADLHDTTARLIEKGCINEIVPWRKARTFFYWRLKRLLLTKHFEDRILECDKELNESRAHFILRTMFLEHNGGQSVYKWDDNVLVSSWLQQQKNDENSAFNKRLEAMQKEAQILQIQKSLEARPDDVIEAVIGLCGNVPPQNRRDVIHLLTQMAIEKFEEKFGHET